MLLMIDNYDSFTYNVVQYLGELGSEVKVVRNDELTIAEIEALKPERIVVSPARARRPKRAFPSRPSSISPASCRSWASAWDISRSARRSVVMWYAPDKSCTVRLARYSTRTRVCSRDSIVRLPSPATTP